MTRDEIENYLDGSEKEYDHSKHELLVDLTCVYECDEGDTEVVFVVPIEWLLNFVKTEWNENWNWKRLQKWLLCEYTSEESSDILDKAVEEKQLVSWRIYY